MWVGLWEACFRPLARCSGVWFWGYGKGSAAVLKNWLGRVGGFGLGHCGEGYLARAMGCGGMGYGVRIDWIWATGRGNVVWIYPSISRYVWEMLPSFDCGISLAMARMGLARVCVFRVWGLGGKSGFGIWPSCVLGAGGGRIPDLARDPKGRVSSGPSCGDGDFSRGGECVGRPLGGGGFRRNGHDGSTWSELGPRSCGSRSCLSDDARAGFFGFGVPRLGWGWKVRPMAPGPGGRALVSHSSGPEGVSGLASGLSWEGEGISG